VPVSVSGVSTKNVLRFSTLDQTDLHRVQIWWSIEWTWQLGRSAEKTTKSVVNAATKDTDSTVQSASRKES